MGKTAPDPPDKVRGGYYTPVRIANWLCAWAIKSADDRVLEPSCGDGVFLTSAGSRLLELGCARQCAAMHLTGVEIHEGEARKSAALLHGLLGESAAASVHHADFFACLQQNPQKAFDCVVGNPPFIR